MLQRGLGFGLVLILLLAVACQTPGASPTPTPSHPAPSETVSASVPITEEAVPRSKPEAVKAKLDASEDVVIVDTRSQENYEKKHIEGATSIPLSDIESRHEELPKDKDIVLYCT